MNSVLIICVLVLGASAFPKSRSGCGADEGGALRQPGDNWQDDCNTCRCLASGRPRCTRMFCGDSPNSLAMYKRDDGYYNQFKD